MSFVINRGGKMMRKQPRYEVIRDEMRCDNCRACEYQCANHVHHYDALKQAMISDPLTCVDCQRCVETCHAYALKIIVNRNELRPNGYWHKQDLEEIQKQASSGGILLSAMGNPKNHIIYFDHLLLNASQVTNPSIDPLREPMETNVFLGKRSSKITRDDHDRLVIERYPHLHLSTPILFSAMSLGAISFPAHQAMLAAAKEFGTFYNCGEGGLPKGFQSDPKHIIVQVASGRFGVDVAYLDQGSAVEIKIGQGAKPGIGGHLPSRKNHTPVSETRMIEPGSEAISPAPHHDIYSIEDLKQLVDALKATTNYEKPIIVKVAAVHNIAAICSGIARSGADIIAIDGYRGGSGAVPTRIRDAVGIPIELALASVDQALCEEGIREEVSLIASGGIRNSSDVIKAIALGADAVAIGSSALIAMGCHLCGDCAKGNCNWGIATQQAELTKRLSLEQAKKQLVNLLRSWTLEIKEMMGGMGISSVEALKGNRMMLRGLHLHDNELRILGVSSVGSR